ncbi:MULTISPECIES: ferritin [Sporomusa]|jgi:ferritin|uniref:Ferritin n=1 Tax=Sporomusa sphaeroides DSM 2875 TaxID=1337886 RepID=A0ABP2CBV1_9FIRM|nr:MULTISPECIES: ferritin [Sporomusa]MCM0757718.1 ferritin [Sporomusa sphaeroides DSM 2875]OLS57649.1 ferritin [Sporomusa sphaeroides DSM 2875]CVK21326.1 Ferritin [Sporomusa sphaeroides DSM 2875]
MISAKLQKAINNQIQAEMYSANLYLSMSGYCMSQNLKGFSNWLRVQYQEETEHALKLLDYLLERGGEVELQAIEAPPTEFGKPVEVFEKVLAHEEHVTSLINKLYEVAVEEKDVAAQIFLQWFVTEQVEEEASAGDILAQLRMIGDKTGGIFFLDKELAARKA